MSYMNYSWVSAIGRDMRERNARAEAERLVRGLDAHVATCELTRDLGADSNCLVCQAHAFIRQIAEPLDALPPVSESSQSAES